jgi:phosphatidate cytidylyltransferase
MLRHRVLTALVLLALLLPTLFWWPAWTWAALTLAFLAVGAHEWAGLLALAGSACGTTSATGSSPPAASATVAGPDGRGDPGRARWAALAVAGIGLLLLAWRATAGWPEWFGLGLAALATAWWCLAAPVRLATRRATGGGLPLAAGLLLACWVALIELHARGPVVLLAAMAIVWIADIAAYFAGRAFGRRKLAPSISPGKSWEGAVGGVLAVIVAAWACAALAGQGGALAGTLAVRVFDIGPWLALPLLAGLTALSVVGVLHESLL